MKYFFHFDFYCDNRDEGLELVGLLAACRWSSLGRLNVTQPMVCLHILYWFLLRKKNLVPEWRLVEQAGESHWGRSGQCGQDCHLQVMFSIFIILSGSIIPPPCHQAGNHWCKERRLENHLGGNRGQVSFRLGVLTFVCLFVVCYFYFFFVLLYFSTLLRWWVGWQDVLKRDGELGWLRLQLMLEEEEEEEKEEGQRD